MFSFKRLLMCGLAFLVPQVGYASTGLTLKVDGVLAATYQIQDISIDAVGGVAANVTALTLPRQLIVKVNPSLGAVVVNTRDPVDDGVLKYTFQKTTVVTLQIQPAPDYALSSWVGCDSVPVANGACTVTMDSDSDKIVNINMDPLLVLTKQAQGSGTVVANPNKTGYEFDEVVTLTATPSGGSNFFQGWAGDCTGTVSSCVITMNSNKVVVATFSNGHPLTVNQVTGGNITPGSQTFSPNAGVNLTATPQAGYYFGSWSGDCLGAGTSPSCNLTMTGPKTVSATFPVGKTLTVNQPNGGAISPETATYAPGTSVAVQATPTSGNYLTGWTGTGACSGASSTCNVVMNVDKAISATFEPGRTLTVNQATGGSISPATSSYAPNAPVQLTATAAANYFFSQWSGDGSSCGTTPTCNLTMSTDKTVSASFASGLQVTVNQPSGGGGSITPSTASYAPGSSQNFTASPQAGNKFVEWTGDCAGQTSATCTLTVNTAKTISAVFAVDNNACVSSTNNVCVTTGLPAASYPKTTFAGQPKERRWAFKFKTASGTGVIGGGAAVARIAPAPASKLIVISPTPFDISITGKPKGCYKYGNETATITHVSNNPSASTFFNCHLQPDTTYYYNVSSNFLNPSTGVDTVNESQYTCSGSSSAPCDFTMRAW